MISRLLVVLIIALASAFAGAGLSHYWQASQQSVTVGRPIEDFALLDQNGTFHQLFDYSDYKALVLYSHNPDCPAGNRNLKELASLQQRFGGESLAILAIDARQPSAKKIAAANSLAKDPVNFPILRDDDQLVSESLAILRSGEALLIDPASWTLRYRGAIDDRSDFESDNPTVTRHYLANAIEAMVHGEPLEFAASKAVGCRIDFGEAPPSLSYRDSIVPILEQRCLECHRQGGVGPWAMDGHATIKAWSAKIREAIMLKKMPPWHVDPAVGEFAHSLALEPSQKKALIRWIDAGAPQGTGPDPLAGKRVGSTERWPLGEPDIVIKVPKIKIPATGILAWQYIKLPAPIEQDTWVRAVHMNPSNRAVTHHIFAFIEYPKERKTEEPKWAEGANSYFAAYVPGYPVVPFPADSGRLIPKGSKIIFQRHYLTIGYETEDKLQLGLYLHDKPPPKEYKMVTAVNMGLRIPPHAPAHPESASITIPEDGTLYAIYPHMHYRGSSIRLSATYPNGHGETLLSVPNYNFQWQNAYQLKHPKPLSAGTQIQVDATFDNSTKNPINPDPDQEVHWGALSSDEMLVAYLLYTAERNSPDLAANSPPPERKTGKP